jgi:hypothetical protein
MRHKFTFEIPPDGCVSDALQHQIVEYVRLGLPLKNLARRYKVTEAFLNYLRSEIIAARLSR